MTAIIKPPIQAGGNLIKTGSTISDGPGLATDVEIAAAVAAHAAGSHASNPPTGGAGGVLSGTFPNPGFAVDMAVQSELDDVADALALEVIARAADVDAEEAARIAADGLKANDADVVKLTGNQTIAGTKTFSSAPTVPDASFSAAKLSFDVATQVELDAEATARANADTTLQTNIDGKQAGDADLTAIAGLIPSNDDVIQRKAGAWTNRTPAQVKTDLALAKGDVGLGNVDNTSDANKPVSTAQQAALDLKANDNLVVKLAGAQTITGKKTFEDAAAATILAASKVTGDSVDRLAWKVGGNLEWSTGAAAADAILSRVTRGLNLAGKLEVFGQNAGDITALIKGFTGQSQDLLQIQSVGGTVLVDVDPAGVMNTQGYKVADNTFVNTLREGFFSLIRDATGTSVLQPIPNGLRIPNGVNVELNTATGTKWGQAATVKQAWWNATPVVQPTAVADATGGATIDAEARTALNALLARMRTIGMIAT